MATTGSLGSREVCARVCVYAEALWYEYRLGDSWAALQTLERGQHDFPNFPFPAAHSHPRASTPACPPPTPPMSRPSSCSMAAAALTGLLGYDTLTVSDAAR